MTNETTASQPKVALISDTTITNYAPLDSLLERAQGSQPKSIGDDAQFTELLTRFFHEDTVAGVAATRAKIIALIDSRAPADQASATIQAAPTFECGACHGSGWVSRDPDIGTEQECFCCGGSGEDEEAALIAQAATIQEPVMVAEPVTYLRWWARQIGEGHGNIGHEEGYEECKPGELSDDGSLAFPVYAAPMVADPAGVAADHDEAITLLSAVFDAWENGDDCHEDGDPSAAYMGKAFKLDDEIFDRCCVLLNRLNPPRNASSATVKAVPSEALDGARFDFIEKNGYSIGCNWKNTGFAGPEGNEWQAYIYGTATSTTVYGATVRKAIDAAMKIAAPLADKTGGDQ